MHIHGLLSHSAFLLWGLFVVSFAHTHNGRLLRGESLAARVQSHHRRAEGKFFVWLTDSHIDPYYGTELQACTRFDAQATAGSKYGVVGCDPPYALIESAVAAAAAKRAPGGVEFVLSTGDFVRHHEDQLPDRSVAIPDIVRNTTRIMGESFGPTKLLVGVLGNSDLPHDYELAITSPAQVNPWLSNIGQAFVKEGAMEDTTFQTYSHTGFFEERRLGGLRVLNINTVIYSKFHKPAVDPLPLDPFGQLAWLRERLQDADSRNESVWIMGHVPPGIETYGYTELWHQVYVDAYLALVQHQTLGKRIAAQLFGHVHADEFRLLPSAPPGAGPVLLSCALSPVYKSNPCFRIVEYDPDTGRLLDYQEYYAVLQKDQLRWEFAYRLTEKYPLQDDGDALTHSSFEGLSKTLSAGGQEWETFSKWYKAGQYNDLGNCIQKSGNEKTACIGKYLCGVEVVSLDAYAKCANVTASQSDTGVVTSDLKPFYDEIRSKRLPSLGLEVPYDIITMGQQALTNP